jgi:hypothetical protein
VYRSPTNYGNFNINKPVHLIGAGYYGAIVNNDDRSSVSFTILSDSVFIDGFHSLIGVGAHNKFVKNITLTRIYGYFILINVEECLIKNSLILYIDGNQIKSDKVFIFNNIFQGHIINRKGSTLISNNLFPYDQRHCPDLNLRSVLGGCNLTTQTAIIQNNIFVNGTPSMAEYSSFNNNLTFQTGQDVLPYGNNSGDDNIIATSPKFRSNNYNSLGLTQIVGSSIDFRLADDSPCINAGTDSTDIGITGGPYPWPRNDNGTLDYTGKPSLPQLVNFTLKPAVVGTDGTLRFNVKGTKSK